MEHAIPPERLKQIRKAARISVYGTAPDLLEKLPPARTQREGHFRFAMPYATSKHIGNFFGEKAEKLAAKLADNEEKIQAAIFGDSVGPNGPPKPTDRPLSRRVESLRAAREAAIEGFVRETQGPQAPALQTVEQLQAEHEQLALEVRKELRRLYGKPVHPVPIVADSVDALKRHAQIRPKLRDLDALSRSNQVILTAITGLCLQHVKSDKAVERIQDLTGKLLDLEAQHHRLTQGRLPHPNAMELIPRIQNVRERLDRTYLRVFRNYKDARAFAEATDRVILRARHNEGIVDQAEPPEGGTQSRSGEEE